MRSWFVSSSACTVVPLQMTGGFLCEQFFLFFILASSVRLFRGLVFVRPPLFIVL